MSSVFIVTALILNITPGPSVIYVCSRTLTGGLLDGFASATGITLGGIVYIVLVASGLSAVIVSQPGLMNALQIGGGVYLIYLAYCQLKAPPHNPHGFNIENTNSPVNALLQGILVELLNPKILIFFIALLPQFLPEDQTNSFFPLLWLGVVYYAMGTVVNLLYAAATQISRGRILSRMNSRVLSIASASALFLIGIAAIGTLS